MRSMLIASVLLGLLISGGAALAQTDPRTPAAICAEAPAEEPTTREFSQAEQVLEDGVDYSVVFCTDLGPVYVDLYEEQTPLTVNNFVFLAQNGFYNNSVFHRVIRDFMVQGGDPVGNPPGTGGPGYQFADEFLPSLNFDRPGLLAMANSGPATNGSQFFITTVPTDWLNQRHTIFGEVIVGQDVVDAIPDNQSNPTLTTALNTVVVITDPTSVEAVEFVPEPATREEVEAVFAEMPALVGATFVDALAVDETLSGVRDTADWVALAAEADQEAIAAYYASHGHAYNANAVIANVVCDLTLLPIQRIAYSIDFYGSAEDAQAAFADTTLIDLQQGLEALESTLEGYQTFMGTGVGCDREDLTLVRGWRQMGRVVTMVEIVVTPEAIPSDLPATEIADVLVIQLGEPFESALLRDILRPESR